MRRKLNKIISIAMSILMIIGIMPMSLFNVNAEELVTNYKYEKVTSINDIDAKYLLVYENEQVALNNNGKNNNVTNIKIESREDDYFNITNVNNNMLWSFDKTIGTNDFTTVAIQSEGQYLSIKGSNINFMETMADIQAKINGNFIQLKSNSKNERYIYFDGSKFSTTNNINKNKNESNLSIYKQIEDSSYTEHIVTANYYVDGKHKHTKTNRVKHGETVNLKHDTYSKNEFLKMEYGEHVLTEDNYDIKVTENATINYYYRSSDIQIKADTQITPVKYFSTTMYDYDGGAFNEVTHDIDDDPKNKLYFRTASGLAGNISIRNNNAVNSWINGQDDIVTTGIVENSLDENGKIVFRENTKNAGLFENTTNEEVGRYVYEDVQFPFKYESQSGYYTFDSSNMHVHSNKKSEEQLTLYQGSQTIGGNSSFFPYNKDNDSSANHYFGLNMGVDFYMNQYGTIDGKTDGQPIVFDFSGDDDVWVFINNQLVLDIGGTHQAIGGTIDFKTGNITYYNPRNSTTIKSMDIYGQNEKVATATNLYEIDGISRESLSSGNNTLQIFYLERGAGPSNCKISFNLPQKDTLEVIKNLDPHTDKEFTFKLYKEETVSEETVSKEYKAVRGASYNVFKGQSDTGGTGVTSNDGIFTIKAGQKAKFTDLTPGNYKVVETNKLGYETTVTISGGTRTTSSDTQEEASSGVITIASKDTTNPNYTPNLYTVTFNNSTDFDIEDDVVVLDYGKSVKLDVRKNDSDESKKVSTLYAIGADGLSKDNKDIADGYKTITEEEEEDPKLSNGTIKIVDANNVEFTPTTFMNQVNKAIYAVQYKSSNSDGSTSPKYKYATIKIIPATSVYYEDNFSQSGTSANGTNGIIYSESWGTIGTDSNSIYQNPDSIYGYDSSYNNNSKDSNGSSHLVTGNNDGSVYAQFTFNGTGFDIISRTSTDTGAILVEIFKGKGTSGESVATKIVSTEYKNGNLYQIPVVAIRDLDYGEYTVKITVSGKNNISTGNVFYLDAIRIYNPLGVDDQVSQEALEEYKQDHEAYPRYIKLRSELISSYNKGNQNKTAVFVDGDNGAQPNLDNYISIGPNNEVYLGAGQSIAIKVNTTNVSSVQIGAKNLGDEYNSTDTDETTETEESIIPVLNVNGTDIKSLTTATEMYYDIPKNIINDGNLVIENNGNGILSLTSLKLTYNTKPSSSSASLLKVDDSLLELIESLNLDLEIKSAKFTKNSVKPNNTATLEVKCSQDVEKLEIKDSNNKVVKLTSIKSSNNKNGEKTFKVNFKVGKNKGKSEYKVYGINGNNKSNTGYKVSINVKLESLNLDLEIKSAKFTKNSVKPNNTATLEVKCSQDVEKLEIKDSNNKVVKLTSIKSSNNKNGEKTFKVNFKVGKNKGKSEYKVYGINGNNKSNTGYKVSINVK